MLSLRHEKWAEWHSAHCSWLRLDMSTGNGGRVSASLACFIQQEGLIQHGAEVRGVVREPAQEEA